MEKPLITIVIADDHTIFRDGLKALFRKQPYLKVVGEAKNGKELLEIVRVENPSVVIIDIKMPQMDGIEATREILAFNPDICIIAMSMSDDESIVVAMLEAGAKGYLLKDASKEEILRAVDYVMQDIPYYSHAIISMIVRLSQKKTKKPAKTPDLYFSEKELEIITLLCKEMTSKEIGNTLFSSHKTIEYHKTKIMEKMGVKSTIGIVIFAIRNDIVNT